jgi:L-iditol 2-dehydrogenase
MIAAQLVGIRELVVGEFASPEIRRETDVLVDVKAVGICGSDVHNYAEGGIGKRKVDYPFIPGHEAAGVVSAIGSGVTHVKPGDRIMIEPAHHCGECDQCRAGRFNTCRKIQFMSSAAEIQGCMCERVVVPEQNCFRIPDSVTFEQAAVAEPLSIALYSVKQSIPMTPETPVAILGSGPIGLCTMLAAQASGGTRVFMTDKIPDRLELARELGAEWVGTPDSVDVVAELRKEMPLGFPVVFECSGDAEALDQAVELLAPGGMLVITGIPEGHRISLSIDTLRRNEITIYNVRRQNQTVAETIQLVADGVIDVDALVTHRVQLADAKRAFDLVADYADGVVKAMVVND